MKEKAALRMGGGLGGGERDACPQTMRDSIFFFCPSRIEQ